MSAQSKNLTEQLLDLLDSLRPIMKDLGDLIIEAKQLHSKYSAQFNYIAMCYKIDGNIKIDLLTEDDLETAVKNVRFCLAQVREILQKITSDGEESSQFLKAGIFDKFQTISQRMSDLLSKP